MDVLSRFSLPTEVIFGAGICSRVGQEAKKLGIRKALFVTDPGVSASGVLEPALSSLRKSDIPFFLFDQAPGDPDTRTIDNLAAILKQEECDGVVASGGGSAMCTGKATAVLATNGGSIADYFGNEKFRNAPLPSICMPTTAGSGSEVSKHTTLTDAETGEKTGVTGYRSAPKVAILDPTLLRTVPRTQAIASGVDALTHAVEAYLSSRSTPITDAIALRAIEMIGRNLCTSILSHDMESKGEMILAASMANIACGNAGLGLVHATNSVITSYYKAKGLPPVAYGLIHAILLPHVLAFNLPACERKVPALALSLGIRADGTPVELSKSIVERVDHILRVLDAPQRLGWDGVSPGDLIEEGLRMGRLHLDLPRDNPNPRKYSRGELASILEKVL